MPAVQSPDSDILLAQAAAGDDRAVQQLLTRHRNRLRRMVAVRLDRRLAARVDPSDVVQETLAEAARRLPDYLAQRPMQFYPWLRRLAFERVLQLHRRHIKARARSVVREESLEDALPDHSAERLAERLLARGSAPSARILREEVQRRVRQALAALSPRDREVLVLRYLEQLTTADTAQVLDISAEGVKSRQRRALERFSELMADESRGGKS